MFKTCDDCGKKFDIFQEGYGHQFFVVCGECWATQMKRRQIGGIFTRGA
jgi:predicted nucleic acid-binding Zn ribbon protein